MNLDFLTERWDYWTPEQTENTFYKDNVKSRFIEGGIPYAIEKSDTGFLIVQPDSATFFESTTGRVYRLDKNWNTLDYTCNLDLYDRSIVTKSFYVDKPLEYKIVKVNGQLIQFSILERPFASLGIDIGLDISNQNYSIKHLEDWIEDTAIIIPKIIDVATRQNSKLPGNGVLITDRLRHLNNLYSWKGFRKWGSAKDLFLQRTINSIQINTYLSLKIKALQNGEEINPTECSYEIKRLANLAQTKWNMNL